MKKILLFWVLGLCSGSGFSLKITLGMKYSSRDCIHCYLAFHTIFKMKPDIPVYCGESDRYNIKKFLTEFYGDPAQFNVRYVSKADFLDTVSFSSVFIADFDSRQLIALKSIKELNADDFKLLKLFTDKVTLKRTKKGKFIPCKSLTMTPGYAIHLAEELIFYSNKGRLWRYSLQSGKCIQTKNWGDEAGFRYFYDKLFKPGYYDESVAAYGETFSEVVRTVFRCNAFQVKGNKLYFVVTLPFLTDESHFSEKSVLCEVSPYDLNADLLIYSLPPSYERSLNYNYLEVIDEGELLVPHYNSHLNADYIFYKGIIQDSVNFSLPYFPILFDLDSLVSENRYTYIAQPDYLYPSFVAFPFSPIISTESGFVNFSWIHSLLNVIPPSKIQPFQFNGMTFDSNSFSNSRLFLLGERLRTVFYLNGFTWEMDFHNQTLEPLELRIVGRDFRYSDEIILWPDSDARLIIHPADWTYEIEQIIRG